MFRRRLLKNLDYTLIGATLCILGYGLLMIGAARTSTAWINNLLAQRGIDKNIMEYLWEAGIWERLTLINTFLVYKQLFWIIVGLVVMGAAIYFSYEVLPKYSRKIYFLILVLLVLVLVIGETVMGSQRWIQIGPLGFQPSEFTKILYIIFLAEYLSSREGYLNRFKDLIPCFAISGVPVLLIILQPDLGTSLVYIAILFSMLYAAGAKPVLLGGILGSVGALGIGSIWAHLKFGTWLPLKEYQLERLTIFLNPWKEFQGAGYHMIQSQIAIGSSGLTGEGLLRGTQSLCQFLPVPESDFIFSVLAEQLGFLGAFVLLALYAVLLYRVLKIGMEAKDTFGMLVSVGVASMFTFHILINAGMTMGIMPVTGLPLPLFSYGGSNLIACMAGLGLVLNVQLRKQKILF